MGKAGLREVELSGRDYLRAATALLLRAQAEDTMAGLFEAGDIQWWWKDEAGFAATRHSFWLDDEGAPLACLLIVETAASAKGPGGIECELLWRPSADAIVRRDVLPVALSRVAALEVPAGGDVSVTVDERDGNLRRRVEATGFRHEPTRDIVQMWQRPGAPPAPVPLPAGLRFEDDRSRAADQPHHLAKRNGEHVADKLRETSLYQPELDLAVRTEGGEVAAYCLCWLDRANRVGLFEPVRTEEPFQRRGIGRALLTEGIRRMMAGGAELIKVVRDRDNAAARGLYASVGFDEGFRALSYVRRGGDGVRMMPSDSRRPALEMLRLNPDSVAANYPASGPFAIGTPTMLPYSVQEPS